MVKRWKAWSIVLAAAVFGLAGCSQQDSATAESAVETEAATEEVTEAQTLDVEINGRAVTMTASETTDLNLLTVEDGITISIDKAEDAVFTVNGDEVEDEVHLDVDAITRDDVIEMTYTEGEETSTYTVNMMPSTFPDYTVEGESVTDGDYYMSTYGADYNYIFKLDNTGNLIFYKYVGKGKKNSLDFRKYYNSDGEVRYTYMKYKKYSLSGMNGINPGFVVVMDEDYNVIDELYYQTSDGEDGLIDPHGFIYIDDGHYILTHYEATTVENIPEDLGAQDNSAQLAVLYIQEIKDGEVQWEFCSSDYEQFLYATTVVDWSASMDAYYDYVHFNSMSIDQDENILVSLRNSNCIIKVDRETGELIWMLGGGTQDEFGLTEDQVFSKQHSIIVTEDGSYMLFNNGNDEVENEENDVDSSSIIRLKVDEESKTITEYVEYDTDFYSNFMGSIRELDAENSVYLWAVGGNYLGEVPDRSMVEYIEEDGEMSPVFTFYFNDGTRQLYAANKCV